jgi:hypothetical protein
MTEEVHTSPFSAAVSIHFLFQERTFKKAVLKSAMAARVVDRIEPDRAFTAEELARMFE